MQQPEAWLRGPVPGVPAYLMPVAHALIQTMEEVERTVPGLTSDELWARPGGAASVGFHVRHIAGVVDRLLTYARGEPLSSEQLEMLRNEEEPGTPPPEVQHLLRGLRASVERALAQIRTTPVETLLEPRGVGRKRTPSNVLGLLFHAAEHAQRHTGQIVATVRCVRGAARANAGDRS